MSAFSEIWQDAKDYSLAIGETLQDAEEYADKRVKEVTEDNTWWHRIDKEMVENDGK